ncbi:MAG: MFS transporter [Acetobacteraceae bacterium]|nr:MFS transporter [Acetobacteraceae bacterium]
MSATALRRALPRDVWLLFANLLLASIPVGYLQVVLPLYLDRAALDPGAIGLLYTASGLVSAGLVAVSGLFADRFGKRRFVLWGTLLPIVSFAIFAATAAPGWLGFASLLGGVGLANGAAGALTAASFDALLAEHTPEARRTRVFSLAQIVWDIALGLGAALAGLPDWLRAAFPALGELGAYRPPFVGLCVLAALAALAVLPVRDDGAVSAARARGGWLPRRSGRVIAWYAVAVGGLGLGLGVAVQLMPLWFNRRFGVDEAALGPWYGLGQVLSLVALVAAPWLAQRLGSGWTVLWCQVLGAACLALMAFSPGFEWAAVLFLARTVLTNVAWPLQQALLMGAVAPQERASAAGLGFAVWGLANGVGPSIGGALLGQGLLLAPILVGAAAYAAAGLVFGLGFAGRPRPVAA